MEEKKIINKLLDSMYALLVAANKNLSEEPGFCSGLKEICFIPDNVELYADIVDEIYDRINAHITSFVEE